MLELLILENFKCFKSLKLPLAPLTLLAGSNASGKSTVLHALSLLGQTFRDHEWSTRLMLNGSSVRLGTVGDIVNKVHGRRSFGLGIIGGSASCFWSFCGDRTDMSMGVDRIGIDGKIISDPKKLRFLLPPKCDKKLSSLANNLRTLTYITAERVGPREVYPLEDPQTAIVVGPSGEYSASVLYFSRDEHVNEDLVLTEVPVTLQRQVEARMNQFFPGCSLSLQLVPQANALTLGLRTSNDTDFHRPIHVGFGLTQVLPIVIAALSATKGSILLVENPEVHLHPAGQSLMGQFLAKVACSGVQVIVETHSDHILNGIRRTVKSKIIQSDNIAIHFFRDRTDSLDQVISIMISEMGDIETWPTGFFDQFDRDTNYFAGWGE